MRPCALSLASGTAASSSRAPLLSSSPRLTPVDSVRFMKEFIDLANSDDAIFSTAETHAEFIAGLRAARTLGDLDIVRRRLESGWYVRAVPAPRLVGIELNPGPPRRLKSDLLVENVANAGKTLGTLLAGLAKKKKLKSKVKALLAPRRVIKSLDSTSSAVVRAPAMIGTQHRTSTVKHSPFVVSGNCHGGYFGLGNTGVQVLSNIDGVQSPINAANIDPVGGGAVQTNFMTFSRSVQAIAGSFTRYRFKKLLLNYVPVVSTFSDGMIAIAVSPEVVVAGTAITSGTVFGLQLKVTSPVWAPITIDTLANGGLRKDWLFVDTTTTTLDASQRQETPGSFCFSLSGVENPVTFKNMGMIFWDYEIEFDGIAANANYSSSDHSQNTPQTGQTLSVPVGVPHEVSTSSPPLCGPVCRHSSACGTPYMMVHSSD